MEFIDRMIVSCAHGLGRCNRLGVLYFPFSVMRWSPHTPPGRAVFTNNKTNSHTPISVGDHGLGTCGFECLFMQQLQEKHLLISDP